MTPPRLRSNGFSLIELTLAMALLLLVTGGIFQALDPAHGAFQTEPEKADLQQRLRVAAAVLAEAVAGAGAGPSYGPAAGPLVNRLPPVLPLRIGRRNADPAGSFRTDAITVMQTSPGAAQTTLAQPLAAASGIATIALEPGCSLANASCGFVAGRHALVIGEGGRFDLFTVTAVSGTALTLQHDTRDSSYTYPAGTTIVEATVRAFHLKADAANNLLQLVRYDGDGGADAPIVDHIASLAFSYQGAPDAPRVLNPPTAASGPWTSYGPRPPDPAAPPLSGHVAGENCLFALDAAARPASRLPALPGSGLVTLPATQFTDGPWCPDAADPNRFDADLFRVRAVRIAIRVEAAAASLRGTAAALFARPGTASGSRFVPDQEISLEIAPPNLTSGGADDPW